MSIETDEHHTKCLHYSPCHRQQLYKLGGEAGGWSRERRRRRKQNDIEETLPVSVFRYGWLASHLHSADNSVGDSVSSSVKY